MKKVFWVLSCLLAFVLPLTAGAEVWASRLLNVRQWTGPEHTRIVIDVQGTPEYEIIPPPDSTRLVVKLKNISLAKGQQEISVKSEIIRMVTVTPKRPGEAEVAFSFPAPARWNVFVLTGAGGKPNRLVLDFFKGKKEEVREKPQLPAAPKVEEGPGPAKIKELPQVREAEKIPPQVKAAEKTPVPVKEPEKTPVPVKEPEKAQVRAKEPERTPVPEPEKTPVQAKEPERTAVQVKEAEKIPVKDAGPIQAKYKILDVRQWSAPDHTRVVIDLAGRPVYEISASPDSLTWTLQLENAVVPEGGKDIAANDPIVRSVKVARREGDRAEIRIGLVKPVRFEVFVLEPYLDKPNRLVIDFFRPDLEQKEKAERLVIQQLKAKKTHIIVIDPGHGGEDPGAVGPRKTQEKDIVLALSRKLQKALDETGSFRAFLTRRGDYFVALNDRIKIAQEYGADLFISVHANASPKRQARGTSVYCLSLKGASDKATQLLAQSENASDMIGGIARGAARRDLDTILLDLQQTHTINESLQLGGIVLSELKRANYIQFSQPMQAGFAVLKAHNIPSVLVEIAYISHPIEEKFLKKEAFQSEMIKGLVKAVQKFMPLLALKDEGAPEADKMKGMAGGG